MTGLKSWQRPLDKVFDSELIHDYRDVNTILEDIRRHTNLADYIYSSNGKLYKQFQMWKRIRCILRSELRARGILHHLENKK